MPKFVPIGMQNIHPRLLNTNARGDRHVLIAGERAQYVLSGNPCQASDALECLGDFADVALRCTENQVVKRVPRGRNGEQEHRADSSDKAKYQSGGNQGVRHRKTYVVLQTSGGMTRGVIQCAQGLRYVGVTEWMKARCASSLTRQIDNTTS